MQHLMYKHHLAAKIIMWFYILVLSSAKVIQGRAILAKGIAERKNLPSRVLIRQKILSLISYFFSKISSILHRKPVKEKEKKTEMWGEKKIILVASYDRWR